MTKLSSNFNDQSKNVLLFILKNEPPIFNVTNLKDLALLCTTVFNLVIFNRLALNLSDLLTKESIQLHSKKYIKIRGSKSSGFRDPWIPKERDFFVQNSRNRPERDKNI